MKFYLDGSRSYLLFGAGNFCVSAYGDPFLITFSLGSNLLYQITLMCLVPLSTVICTWVPNPPSVFGVASIGQLLCASWAIHFPWWCSSLPGIHTCVFLLVYSPCLQNSAVTNQGESCSFRLWSTDLEPCPIACHLPHLLQRAIWQVTPHFKETYNSHILVKAGSYNLGVRHPGSLPKETQTLGTIYFTVHISKSPRKMLAGCQIGKELV